MASAFLGLVDEVQAMLNFRNCSNVQFNKNGLGKIGTTGFVIGIVGGFHLCGALFSTILMVSVSDAPLFLSTIRNWCAYMALLCIFHFLEFFVTAVKQPEALCFDSYIVNHSRNYTMAAVSSWIEFWIETYIFGHKKNNFFVFFIGLLLVVMGQAIRSIAMWTCGEHFAHQIMDEKTESHRLVKSGIYSIFRHPSYFGWFYWSIGTQLMLCNPVSAVLYTWASWSFFASRIPYEEHLLLQFYGDEYLTYCRQTIIGIPAVRSPSIERSKID